MWCEDTRECWTDASHALKFLHRAEWTERIAVRNDACGKRGTDAWEPFDFSGRSNIDINAQARRD